MDLMGHAASAESNGQDGGLIDPHIDVAYVGKYKLSKDCSIIFAEVFPAILLRDPRAAFLTFLSTCESHLLATLYAKKDIWERKRQDCRFWQSMRSLISINFSIFRKIYYIFCDTEMLILSVNINSNYL